jgi:hypothetical protein
VVGLPRRQRNQRVAVITTASAVASAIAKKPSAIHWAAPMASAVLDESADRSNTIPLSRAATR